MTDITVPRADLAAGLAPIAEKVTGFQVYDHVPERLVAPCAVIEPADPYLTDDEQPFESMRVNYTITLVAREGTNAKATSNLDALVNALIDTGLDVPTVSQPIRFNYNTANYLAAVATYHDTIKIGA